MYEYLSKLNFTPKSVLDIGAWNGYWTKKVKDFVIQYMLEIKYPKPNNHPILKDSHFSLL